MFSTSVFCRKLWSVRQRHRIRHRPKILSLFSQPKTLSLFVKSGWSASQKPVWPKPWSHDFKRDQTNVIQRDYHEAHFTCETVAIEMWFSCVTAEKIFCSFLFLADKNIDSFKKSVLHRYHKHRRKPVSTSHLSDTCCYVTMASMSACTFSISGLTPKQNRCQDQSVNM